MDAIKYLNDLKDGIYLYNWLVEPSDLGLPWVRLRHYSCIPFYGEKDLCQDFHVDDMRHAFEDNQGVDNPEDFLSRLNETLRTAGPIYYI